LPPGDFRQHRRPPLGEPGLLVIAAEVAVAHQRGPRDADYDALTLELVVVEVEQILMVEAPMGRLQASASNQTQGASDVMNPGSESVTNTTQWRRRSNGVTVRISAGNIVCMGCSANRFTSS